jgi:hypothetical protein
MDFQAIARRSTSVAKKVGAWTESREALHSIYRSQRAIAGARVIVPTSTHGLTVGEGACGAPATYRRALHGHGVINTR